MLGEAYALDSVPDMARAERVEPTEESLDSEKALGEAVFWYLHLRLVQLDEQNVNGPAIQRATGISKQQVGQIQRGVRVGGLLTLIRLSKLDHRSPGRLLDEALEWWRVSGPSYRDRRIDELAVQKKEGKPKKRIRPLPSLKTDKSKARESLRSIDQSQPKVPVRSQKP